MGCWADTPGNTKDPSIVSRPQCSGTHRHQIVVLHRVRAAFVGLSRVQLARLGDFREDFREYFREDIFREDSWEDFREYFSREDFREDSGEDFWDEFSREDCWEDFGG